MLLERSKAIPTGSQWLHEIKWDGYRCIAVKDGGKVSLWSRNGRPFKQFPAVADSVRALAADSVVLDGEIVCLLPDGRPCFENLQGEANPANVFLYAFDLLHWNGADLISLPMVDRKGLLSKLLRNPPDQLRLSPCLEGDPENLFAMVREMGLEGIVSKLASSKYEAGRRSGHWRKVKAFQVSEFLVGGYLRAGNGFDAIAVGEMQDGSFAYRAKLEAYLRAKGKSEWMERFKRLAIPGCPFESVPDAKPGSSWSAGIPRSERSKWTWIKPKLAVKIQYLERTKAGYLRHGLWRAESRYGK